MPDILDRIKKLMELALHNPNDAEARSAAIAAVRLIDQHKIELRTKAEAAPKIPMPPPYDGADAARDLMDLVRRAQQAAGQTGPRGPFHRCHFVYDPISSLMVCKTCRMHESEAEYWYPPKARQR